jgi:NDP-sugar pyrophosphorylase family protein
MPMAGPSDDFKNAGYYYPKPLIDIEGKPIIEYVIERLKNIDEPKKFIFIILEEDARRYHLDSTLKLLVDNPVIILLKQQTKGALCSVLMAVDHIHSDDEMLILNSDQVIDIDANIPINFFRDNKADTGIITFQSVHPRWSFALIENNKVVQTAEKNPISRNAIAGFYYFSKAALFFRSSFKTLLNQDQLDQTFFISSAINQYILNNANNINFQIENTQYHSFYAPQKIREFELYLHQLKSAG